MGHDSKPYFALLEHNTVHGVLARGKLRPSRASKKKKKK
jgi:hypothetical protein